MFAHRGISTVQRRETVRKVSEAPAAWPYVSPENSFSAHFALRIPAKFTVGALLQSLFRQFQELDFSHSRKFGVHKASTRKWSVPSYALTLTGIQEIEEDHMRSLGRSIKNFSADDMLVYAAALSYQLFFSLFPFVIFLLALLGVLNLTSFFDWLIKQSQTVLPG
jgi:hypothetical protein